MSGRLPNSTSMSLHERFSQIRNSSGGQRLAGNFQGKRQKASLLQKASSKNNRLKQQMDRRATAMAALKIKKKSIKQRLGQPTMLSTKIRGTGAQKGQRKLATGRLKTTQSPTAKPVRGRGSVTAPIRSQTIVRGGGRSRGGSRAKATAQQVQQQGSPTKRSPSKGRGGRGGTVTPKSKAQQLAKATPSPRMPTSKRGKGRAGRAGSRGQQQRQPQNNGGGKNDQPGNKKNRGRGRGGRRGGGLNGPKANPKANAKLSKEDLDKQLEQYMSKGRQALQQDLDMGLGDVEMK